jgi:hypothetical protein
MYSLVLVMSEITQVDFSKVLGRIKPGGFDCEGAQVPIGEFGIAAFPTPNIGLLAGHSSGIVSWLRGRNL